ncbi:MAG: hypothetical protein KDK90_16225 [Leptospiraceae bacterium]|nr:hypothetical protein [Leptospiraceae bacterium]
MLTIQGAEIVVTHHSEDMDIDLFGGGIDTLKKNGYKIFEDLNRVLQKTDKYRRGGIRKNSF